jgi:hypothetical protein
MKSLHCFMEQKKSVVGVKICASDFRFEQRIQSIPLYAIEALVKEQAFPGETPLQSPGPPESQVKLEKG